MADLSDLDLPQDGKLAENIAHFGRALRAAGLPVGPGRVIEACRAIAVTGIGERGDFYHALQACFITRPEQREVFHQVFRLFWRDPQYLEHMMAMLLPSMRGAAAERAVKPAEKRAAAALLDGVERPAPELPDSGETKVEADATLSMSAEQRLKSLDFEQMSPEEVRQAQKMLARLNLSVPPLLTRRHQSTHYGRLDARATLRAALRQGGEITRLHHYKPRRRWPNLVVLCDISGSMSAYSRAVLLFLHAVCNHKGQGWASVHGFTFGTELTNITRLLRQRDADAALADIGHGARDWQGGTRIGACLAQFNRDWSRRVLGSGAVVLLVTDGLERQETAVLKREAQRLQLSCKRLIWLNPLLRWQGFAPEAGGIRALLPHVDSFRAGHNISSLEALGAALGRPEDGGEKARLLAMLRAG
ncbi:vWA domain-containing protein [Candidatus Halocynthiibacter alkanivorans]|uniref:vWA domain-containing protein n=1 Tax=Candidatus Halocynthiibacter alkanivorans TaxID=2267619 RepID=UPI000DF400C3|nr:VWA domain-containing protein [Candidatus Halocynthiibacter alkanivorans]